MTTNDIEDLVRPLLKKDDPILRKEASDYDFLTETPDIDPIKLAHILAQSCLAAAAPGLAANQIGIDERALIINADPMICMINPTIVDFDKETVYNDEASVLFPAMILKIKRPASIRVRYMAPNTEILTAKYDGVTSWMVQQMVDHLDGILFTDRATAVHLEQAKKELRKWKANQKIIKVENKIIL